MLLAAIASMFAGAISVVPEDACPTAAAVSDELERLGALSALAQVGTAEVAASDSQLHIVIRDRQGLALGSRKVDAPADCASRAALAAVLIAAWTGDWIRTNLGGATSVAVTVEPPASTKAREEGGRPGSSGLTRRTASGGLSAAGGPEPGGPQSEVALTVPARAAPPPVAAPVRPTTLPAPIAVTAAPAPPPQPAGAPLRVELSALGFGIHDGDAGSLGGGVQAVLQWRALTVVALAEFASERQRALGPGYAAYGFLRVGAGAGIQRRWRRVFGDVVLAPELARYALAGQGNLTASSKVAVWGFMAEGRGRLGVTLGRVAPFAFVGTSWSLLRERLWLDDPSQYITLSRFNLAAGLGISVILR